jgi:hypothetical protein
MFNFHVESVEDDFGIFVFSVEFISTANVDSIHLDVLMVLLLSHLNFTA